MHYRERLPALVFGVRASPATANRRFEFQKRCQLFICVHNETLSVVAMRVNNPDRSPVGINRRGVHAVVGFRLGRSSTEARSDAYYLNSIQRR
jgi:hypothetical protein